MSWRDRPSEAGPAPSAAAAAAAAGLVSRPSSFKVPFSGAASAADPNDAPGSGRSSQVGPNSGSLAGPQAAAALSPQPSARALGRMSPSPPSVERTSGGSSSRLSYTSVPVYGAGPGPGPSNFLGARSTAPSIGGGLSPYTTASASLDTPLISPLASPLPSPLTAFHARAHEGGTPTAASSTAAFAAVGGIGATGGPPVALTSAAVAAASLGLRTVSERRIQRLINKIDSVCSNHSAASGGAGGGGGGPNSGQSSRSSMHEGAGRDRRTSAPLADSGETLRPALQPEHSLPPLPPPPPSAMRQPEDGPLSEGRGRVWAWVPPVAPEASAAPPRRRVARSGSGSGARPAALAATGGGHGGGSEAQGPGGHRLSGPASGPYPEDQELPLRLGHGSEPQADVRGQAAGAERPAAPHSGREGGADGRADGATGGGTGAGAGRRVGPAWPSLSHAFAAAATSLLGGGGGGAPLLMLPRPRSSSTGGGTSSGPCSDSEVERELSARQLVRLPTDRSRSGTRLMSGASGTLSSTSASQSLSLSPQVSALGSAVTAAAELQRRLASRAGSAAERSEGSRSWDGGGAGAGAGGRRRRSGRPTGGRKAASPPPQSASPSSVGGRGGGGGESGDGPEVQPRPEVAGRQSRHRDRRTRSRSRSRSRELSGRSRSHSPSLSQSGVKERRSRAPTGRSVAHEPSSAAGAAIHGAHTGSHGSGGSSSESDEARQATRHGLGATAATGLASHTAPQSSPPLAPQTSLTSVSNAAAVSVAAPARPYSAGQRRQPAHSVAASAGNPSSSHPSTSSGQQEHGDTEPAALPSLLGQPQPSHGGGGGGAAPTALGLLALSAEIGVRLQLTPGGPSGGSVTTAARRASSAATALENAASLVALIDEDLGKGSGGGAPRGGAGGSSHRQLGHSYTPVYGLVVPGLEAADAGAQGSSGRASQPQRVHSPHLLQQVAASEVLTLASHRDTHSADWHSGSSGSDGSSGGRSVHRPPPGGIGGTRNRRLSIPDPDFVLRAMAAGDGGAHPPRQRPRGRQRSSGTYESDSSGGIYSDGESGGGRATAAGVGGAGRGADALPQASRGLFAAGMEPFGGGGVATGGSARRLVEQTKEVEGAERRGGWAASSAASVAGQPAAAGEAPGLWGAGAELRSPRLSSTNPSTGGSVLAGGPPGAGTAATAASASLAARRLSNKSLALPPSFSSPTGVWAASGNGATPFTSNAYGGAGVGVGAGTEADGGRAPAAGHLTAGPLTASPGPASGSSVRGVPLQSGGGSSVDIDLLKRDLERLLAR